MHYFFYRQGELYCEGLKVENLTRKLGTPFYLYSRRTMVEHFRKLKDAFFSLRPLICYSMKANSNLAILKLLIREGAGLDIVSGGELFKALKAGVDSQRIVYASVGKTPQEIREALKAGILLFNVESLPELEIINRLARERSQRARVCIRINPGVDASTHHYVGTGKSVSKFGIDMKTTQEIFAQRKRFSSLEIVGIHLHIGSQIIHARPFKEAVKKAIGLISVLRSQGVRLEYLNIGGGLGIIYEKERPQTASAFAEVMLPLLKDLGLKIILEPGRFIVGSAGILATKVLYVKRTPYRKFIIVDAGMNNLLRPALYNAYHEIWPVWKPAGMSRKGWEKADVVGPVCESGDFLARDRLLPPLEAGCILAVMGSGAYGFSMSSNYNSRPFLAEVLVSGRHYSFIRRRQGYADLVRGEIIPRSLR